MTPAVSQACTLAHPFAADIAGAAEAGVRHVELWLTKLEQHLATNSVADTVTLLADRGIVPVAAAYQGGLLLATGEARASHLDHFQRRLSLCEAFGIPVLIVAADHIAKPDLAILAQAIDGLAEAARWAAGFGVRLALEFRGTDAVVTSLETALAVVEGCGESNVGVCLDAFHFYKGPSKTEDLARLSLPNLAHVQFCDVPGVPREVMTDADRVFPGEGDFHLPPIVERLVEINYAGAVSVEVLNPVIGSSKPSQVIELAMAALTRTLGR